MSVVPAFPSSIDVAFFSHSATSGWNVKFRGFNMTLYVLGVCEENERSCSWPFLKRERGETFSSLRGSGAEAIEKIDAGDG